MRPRLTVCFTPAIVLALCVVGSGPAWADSYEDEDEEAEPAEEEDQTDGAPAGEGGDELTAGGLEVPDTFQTEDDQGDQVGRELEEADRKDSGRGLEFAWLIGDIGLGVVDVAGLGRGTFLAPGDPSSGVGLAFAGGIGVRILYFTLGARVAGTEVGNLRTTFVGGELGMKLPLGNLEPFAVLDLGYLNAGGLAAEQTTGGLRGVEGLGLNLGAGADYYLSDHFSVGASLRFGLSFLGRPAQDPADFVGAMDPVYAAGSSATGTNLALALRIGFHL